MDYATTSPTTFNEGPNNLSPSVGIATQCVIPDRQLLEEDPTLERVHGELSSAAFLQLVSDPVRYGWLKPFSALILAFEEDDDERAPDDELLARTRELLLPPQEKTPFGRRYLTLMQREPALVTAHAAVAKLPR